MNRFAGGDDGLRRLISDGNGTTTVGKLEGFQTASPQKIVFHSLRNTCFRLTEAPCELRDTAN